MMRKHWPGGWRWRYWDSTIQESLPKRRCVDNCTSRWISYVCWLFSSCIKERFFSVASALYKTTHREDALIFSTWDRCRITRYSSNKTKWVSDSFQVHSKISACLSSTELFATDPWCYRAASP